MSVKENADFILALWMVHEVNDQTKFFGQLRSNLSSESKILIAEPKFHITAMELERTIETAGVLRPAMPWKTGYSLQSDPLFEAT